MSELWLVDTAQTVAAWPEPQRTPVDHLSPPGAKIALFRSLFRGREDVYPRRFENPMSGDSKTDPLRPVLNPTPIMLSCYRFLPPFSGPFSVFTSGSRGVFSESTSVNLDRINPLLRFSRRR